MFHATEPVSRRSTSAVVASKVAAVLQAGNAARLSANNIGCKMVRFIMVPSLERGRSQGQRERHARCTQRSARNRPARRNRPRPTTNYISNDIDDIGERTW